MQKSLFMPNLTKSRIFNRPKKISSTINIKQAGNNRCRSLLAVGTSQKKTKPANQQEYPYHPSMKIKELECGDLHVTMNVAVNGLLKQWIMYYGSIAEVLKPAKLRQMVLDSARDMVKMYENSLN